MIYNSGCNRMLVMAIILLLTLFPSCADRYIGKQFDTSWWWQVNSLPASATMGDENDYLVFEMTISKTEVDGEYLLEGYVDPTVGKAKSWATFQTNKCHFSIILAKDGVVTDRVSFHPEGSSLSRKLPFRRKFKTGPFDAVTVTWKAGVRG